MCVKLVQPDSAYENSLQAYKAEVAEAGESGTPFILNFDLEDFSLFVDRLNAFARGENLEPGFVPHTTFWLIDKQEEVVAVSNVRHELTPKLRIEGGHIGYGVRPSARRKGYATFLLKESLKEAKKLGIERALLTCDKENVASAKTITKSGGVFDSESFVDHRNAIVQRYWIDI